MTDRLKFHKCRYVNFAPLLSQIIRLVLRPLLPNQHFLLFAKSHTIHLMFHRKPPLFSRRRVTEEWKVEILEEDLCCNGLLECLDRGIYGTRSTLLRNFWHLPVANCRIILLLMFGVMSKTPGIECGVPRETLDRRRADGNLGSCGCSSGYSGCCGCAYSIHHS